MTDEARARCPSFKEAVARFRDFLRSQGWPDRIVWLSAVDVGGARGERIAIKRRTDDDGDMEAEKAYELGRRGKLGVSLEAVWTAGDASCAVVRYPADEREAELLMFPPDGSLKLSVSLFRHKGCLW